MKNLPLLTLVVTLLITSCSDDVGQQKPLTAKQRSERLNAFLKKDRSTAEMEAFMKEIGGQKSTSNADERDVNVKRLLDKAKTSGLVVKKMGTFEFEDGTAYHLLIKMPGKQIIVMQSV